DGEVTLTLPFELVPEMEINLTIGAWAPASIPVADHYSTANGKFMLNAKVDPAGLTGDSRPATVEFRMKLGNGQGYPGSVSVAEDQWKKLSGNEWKGDLSD
ncbi:MAG: hypothetical protein GTO30_05810, partial [Acidobacteria bacterium]|nr:hypothetical protein [Acidobacteriota bacterium]NIQ87232.1 hypothetical protein [Acidobacteriota bacterium]